MILENPQILKSLDAFLRRVIADIEDIVSTSKMQEIEMTRLVFNDEKECYTTGKTIVVGKNFPVFKRDNNNIVYRQAQGVIVHELAHFIFTNFKHYATFINTAPHKHKKSKNIAKSVINILEDYRIENQVAELNPFYKKLFLMVRFHIVQEVSEKIKNIEIANDVDRLNILINSLLFLGFINKPLKTADSTTNEILVSLLPIVRKATMAKSTKDVAGYADEIMILFKKLDIDDSNFYVDEVIEKLMGKLKATGTNTPLERQQIETSLPGSQNSGDKDAPDKSVGLDITKSLELASKDAEDILDDLVSQMNKEVLRLEREDITSDIINNYLNTSTNERLESQIEKEEKEIAELIKDLPPLHSRRRVNIRKPIEIDKYSIGHYESLKNDLRLPILRTTSKLERIKQTKIEDWEYNQKSGSLDTDALTRFIAFDEINIFKKQYPDDERLAMDVMLLVDCSGSNSVEVLNQKNKERLPRYKVNQMIALFLHEVLKSIGWRHSIWAFDSGDTENIAPIVPFTGCFDKKEGLKIRSIGARNANRDGMHIRMAGKHLAGHAETDRKLLIVLSDGQPASRNYSGVAAMSDVYNATQELKELGVKTIGIFSGDEVENRYFERKDNKGAGMYESVIFLNNDSIYEFPDKLYSLLNKEFELEDDSC
ncbi:hypothetical protein O0Q50_20370 [Priestia aryabhattai]|uniref:VWFA domain-containing protein n=1 Tax=Priestia aryabhattai TaxID=412384 RepID=A0AAX6NDF4_PRIAR|nr:hypothetical protein [Priestia aryabhattai]MDU9693535.1 hypothetical protein [Priestia aryabhattai]